MHITHSTFTDYKFVFVRLRINSKSQILISALYLIITSDTD